MHPERGGLLFRTRSLNRRGSSLLAALIVVVVAPAYVTAYRHKWEAGELVPAIMYTVFYFLLASLGLRQVAFYENGIYFPQEPSGPRPRFVAWNSIERYHWDSDLLTVIPGTSILKSGGGAPLTGGSVKVPPDRRAEVENLLARTVAAR
jgi:hypothetical protein